MKTCTDRLTTVHTGSVHNMHKKLPTHSFLMIGKTESGYITDTCPSIDTHCQQTPDVFHTCSRRFCVVFIVVVSSNCQ